MISASGNPITKDFNFFADPPCAFEGALGNAPINSPRTLQHICKPARADPHSKGLQKSCNFSDTPEIFR
jgi:hypothetical protein